MIRWMAFAVATLMLVITTTSAYIRLVQAGVGCVDWPQCYGPSVQATPQLNESDPLLIPRTLHRYAASVAGVLAAVVVFVGWSEWRGRRARRTAIAVLALTVALALLGTITPSPLPAVTLGNLLGGMALFALAVRLWLMPHGPQSERPLSTVASAARIAIVLALMQITLGGTIVARFGATACNEFPSCGPMTWSTWPSLGAFNPFAIGEAPSTGALQLVHLAHRLVAVLVALAALRLGWLARHESGTPRMLAHATIGLVAWQITSGALFALRPGLALALAHNLGAALLLATLSAFAVVQFRRERIQLGDAAFAGAKASE